VQDQLKESVEEGKITHEEFKRHCDNFYKTCTESVPFLAPVPYIDWISLKQVPDWQCAEEELFDRLSCVKKYCEGTSTEWNKNSGITCGANGVMCHLVSRKKV
jgi:hypothetical protein